MQEISLLYHKYGVRELHITDDNFNANPKRVLEFCQLLKESGMRLYLSFPNGVRGDVLTEEVVDALRDAGVYMMAFAIESASPRIQRMIRKNLDLEKVVKMIRYADSRGIITKCAFMIGFVTETKEEIRQTIDLALSLPILHVSIFIVVPYENTELYRITKEFEPQFSLEKNIQFYGYSPPYAKKMNYNLPKIQRWAYFRFYLCSLRLPRLLWRFPRRLYFLKHFLDDGAKAFMQMR
jgi:anaerobic magnesium-protoporphyrin IX monomethyl ester cyclase